LLQAGQVLRARAEVRCAGTQVLRSGAQVLRSQEQLLLEGSLRFPQALVQA
jgi:hypothetical protein